MCGLLDLFPLGLVKVERQISVAIVRSIAGLRTTRFCHPKGQEFQNEFWICAKDKRFPSDKAKKEMK